MIRRVLRKLGWLARRRQRDADLREELDFHLSEEAAERRATGLDEARARAAARRDLGNLTLIAEDTRAAWGWPQIEEAVRDARYAVRLLAKHPGFSAMAVLSLALGIGANSAVFSLVNALLFKPLPVDQPRQLVWFFPTATRSGDLVAISYRDYEDYRAQTTTTFSDVFAFREMPFRLKGDGDAAIVWGAEVSENFFTGIRLNASLGRTFTAADGNAPAAVPLAAIGDSLWRRQFGADPSTVGRRITLNGHAFTIAGVLPPEFSGTRAFGFIPEVWIPLSMHDQVSPQTAGMLQNRDAATLFVMARLRPGTARSQADATLRGIAEQLSRAYRQPTQAVTVRTIDGSTKTNPFIEDSGVLPIASTVTLLLVGCVLLIACANVANLTMARVTSRGEEIALRLALGASRGRLARQLLTESLLLALLGGAVGLALGRWLVDLISRFEPAVDFTVLEREYTFALDWRIAAFTTLATCVAAIASGLAPSLRGARSPLTGAVKGVMDSSGQPRTTRLAAALTVAQVALCTLLLVGAGVSMRSAVNARNIDPGFATERLLMMRVNLALQGYDQPRRKQFLREMRQRLEVLPGISDASLGFPLPLDAYNASRTAVPEGFVPGPGTESGFDIGHSSVGPNYFRAMGTPLVSGREFNDFDSIHPDRVVIVNETMAHRFWPGEDALGKRIRFGVTDGQLATVIGVARDGKYLTLGESPQMYMFLAALQAFPDQASIVVRTTVPPESVVAAVRDEIRRVDASLPVLGIQTIDQYRDRLLGITDLFATLLGAFGAVALALASCGLYGVIGFAVMLRAREIGVRMAIGATRREVLVMILRHSQRRVVVGCAIGLGAAVVLARSMNALLYGVALADLPTMAAVSALVLTVSAAAAFIPARRAASADPLMTLRSP